MKVILAEDSQLTRDTITRILKLKGLEVTSVDDGLPLIEKVKTENYDFIITDLGMINMGGLEATASIREFNKGIDIYLFSVGLRKEDNSTAKRAGVTDSYAKEDFLEVIDEIIDRYR